MKRSRLISIVAAFGLGLMASMAMAASAPVQQSGDSQPLEMRGHKYGHKHSAKHYGRKHHGWSQGNNGHHYGWVRGKHKGWGQPRPNPYRNW